MDNLYRERTRQYLTPSQTLRHKMALADDASQPIGIRKAAYLWLIRDSNLRFVDNETLACFESWVSQPHELDSLMWED